MTGYITLIDHGNGDQVKRFLCPVAGNDSATEWSWVFVALHEQATPGTLQSHGANTAVVPLSITYRGNPVSDYLATLARHSGRWCLQAISSGGPTGDGP